MRELRKHKVGIGAGKSDIACQSQFRSKTDRGPVDCRDEHLGQRSHPARQSLQQLQSTAQGAPGEGAGIVLLFEILTGAKRPTRAGNYQGLPPIFAGKDVEFPVKGYVRVRGKCVELLGTFKAYQREGAVIFPNKLCH